VKAGCKNFDLLCKLSSKLWIVKHINSDVIIYSFYFISLYSWKKLPHSLLLLWSQSKPLQSNLSCSFCNEMSHSLQTNKNKENINTLTLGTKNSLKDHTFTHDMTHCMHINPHLASKATASLETEHQHWKSWLDTTFNKNTIFIF